ncbi:molybdenum cofactor biosynthesis protein MoaE [Tenacibaculum piscium]|uniref:Molybdopterin synthase catalytic subunit n=1 Tax=Tenacibaculum piscium TaxID=1458515 RepID=A0A2H1YK78_9FLAO|nr:molybdenum cofactor biosynthesis protein MoaE [Tenacibaculum piscium]MBE7629395.1 molybdenum cofactor biosynthesis protein MoaE [Tenacibaculum piscium]MBE7671266.1 molybdenum cofactor biosynthesis protein MoaE [Tenacibaculum piscium]MBE7686243.1 molybdenum cofactor biosynthesis protein MoaE [Tenacibaculum piscium]MBE7689977.1 molybdenum cofactor biosynthesis protein MoaE [Tenacibaculum piscium]MCG8183157.1 molybdenum cofactor biosynthesis protein MoaE [Tenacibaculum piscium]
MNTTFIKITSDTLNLQECYNFVVDDTCGGIACFVGTVRDSTQHKKVTQLDFSTYKPMAIKEMQKIADLALTKFSIKKIAIHHAEGLLQIQDIPVIITVSSPHRQAAFDACQFAIDTLKETVPIWKKEYFEDGEVWVNAHP